MITVKHPSSSINANQEELIKKCSVENIRFHELQFSFGNAAHRYHQRGTQLATKLDFEDWIEGLEGPVKKDMIEKGFEKCKTFYPFTRHVRERNDLGFDAFVTELMGENEFSEYYALVNKTKGES